MSKVKVLCVGPTMSGKTIICNFLADATEVSGGEYRPTQGVRILEFEVNGLLQTCGQSSIDVELWDCSGDMKFEPCWSSIALDALGVIYVYNPDQPNQLEDLSKWYWFFSTQKQICENVIFAHRKPNSSDDEKTELSTEFYDVPRINTNIEEYPDDVRNAFHRFMQSIVQSLSKQQDKEELSILSN